MNWFRKFLAYAADEEEKSVDEPKEPVKKTGCDSQFALQLKKTADAAVAVKKAETDRLLRESYNEWKVSFLERAQEEAEQGRYFVRSPKILSAQAEFYSKALNEEYGLNTRTDKATGRLSSGHSVVVYSWKEVSS